MSRPVYNSEHYIAHNIYGTAVAMGELATLFGIVAVDGGSRGNIRKEALAAAHRSQRQNRRVQVRHSTGRGAAYLR